MDCKELDSPPLLIHLFREGIKRDIDRIHNCFDKHYYNQFIKMVYNNLSRKYRFLQDDSDFYGRQAFHDALMSFQDKLSSNGFVEGTAKIKTYFLTFCLYKLRYLITEHLRDGNRLPPAGPEPLEKEIPVIEEADLYDERQLLLNRVMSIMDEKSRRYIMLRKVENRTNEEIAAIMGIQPGSVNNEVYKAVKKCKEIIETLKDKK